MHTLTFVTGCSASGKTAVFNELAAINAVDLEVFELDGDGSPSAGHVDWLRWRAAEHLRVMTDRARDDDDGTHRVVTGIVWPFSLIGEYVWFDAMEAGVDVRFVLLDRDWGDVEATLMERLADWDPEDRDEQIENNRRLQRLLRTQVQALRGGFVATNVTAARAAELALSGDLG